MTTPSLTAGGRLAICVLAGSLVIGCGNDRGPTAPSSPDGGSTTTPPSSGTSSSEVRLTDDLGGRQLFPSDNWWNQDVTHAPVDPQSDAFIEFIGRTRAMHPDFGPPP